MADLPFMPICMLKHLNDTRGLSLEAKGCCIELIGQCWVRGGYVPDDDAFIVNLIGTSKRRWTSLKPIMRQFFDVTERGWSNDAVLKQLEYVTAKVEKNRANGALGGQAKALKDNKTAVATAIPDGLAPTLTHKQTQKEKEVSKTLTKCVDYSETQAEFARRAAEHADRVAAEKDALHARMDAAEARKRQQIGGETPPNGSAVSGVTSAISMH